MLTWLKRTNQWLKKSTRKENARETSVMKRSGKGPKKKKKMKTGFGPEEGNKKKRRRKRLVQKINGPGRKSERKEKKSQMGLTH
jgi:hypothetical protein